MYELALFAGAGGGILGGMLCGHTCIGAVEIEEYPRKVLLARQKDGLLPEFPIWDDIKTFRSDNRECEDYFEFLRSIREYLVISGGFPCQDISAAGKGAGIDGERSGLWSEMARIISEVQPRYAFIENSPLLVGRGLAVVLCDLAQMGYDARWGIVGAHHVGAPHKRTRIWIVAYSKQTGNNRYVGERRVQNETTPDISNVYNRDKEIRSKTWFELVMDGGRVAPEKWRATGYTDVPRPLLLRNDDGVGHVLDRLGACGNGQVPAVAALAWETLT